jgi:hypothetical protein
MIVLPVITLMFVTMAVLYYGCAAFCFHMAKFFPLFFVYRRKKDDGTEPEVDPERDQRTVFAFQVGFDHHVPVLLFYTAA